MKQTLLEMVQFLLSSSNGDEVNSITDTEEAMQIARLIKGVYYDISVDIGLPEHESLFQLVATTDVAKPTIMTVPSTVTKVLWIKYNKEKAGDNYPLYENIHFLNFDEFLAVTQGNRNQTTNVGSMNVLMNGETFEIMYRTNKHPTYYTVVDDHTLIFDSYDNTVDSILQNSKSMAYGSVYPSFTLSDTFIPDLDPTQFPYLVNKSKERMYAEMHQTENREARREARRQKIITQSRKKKIQNITQFDRRPKYGRK